MAGGDPQIASWVAGNAERYNRQLHNDDKSLATRLAARSNGRFTVGQIEEQLRLASTRDGVLNPASDIVASAGQIYDKDGHWVNTLPDTYVQVLTRPDPAVIDYIKANSDRYSWTMPPTQSDEGPAGMGAGNGRDRLSGNVLDEKGGYRTSVEIEGKVFTPRYFPCGSAECVAAGSNVDQNDPETQRWIEARNAKAISDGSLLATLLPVPGGPLLGKLLGPLLERIGVKSAAEVVGAKATLPAATDLGKVSFDAANGIGTIYSPKVTMNAGEVIFDDFAVGTSKGFIGHGPDGASELVGPLKKLLEYTQSQGAKKVTLKGYYASEEGAALGAGKVGEKFSFSFPATKEGLRDFLRGLKQ